MFFSALFRYFSCHSYLISFALIILNRCFKRSFIAPLWFIFISLSFIYAALVRMKDTESNIFLIIKLTQVEFIRLLWTLRTAFIYYLNIISANVHITVIPQHQSYSWYVLLFYLRYFSLLKKVINITLTTNLVLINMWHQIGCRFIWHSSVKRM